MFSLFLLIAGLVTLGLALRSFDHPIPRKLGAACLPLITFTLFYALSGSIAWGVLGALSWALLPWLELITRVRHMRLPIDKGLRRKSPPSREDFPVLEDLTGDIEQEGFEHVEDVGCESEHNKQFFRVFYHEQEKVQAAICLVEESAMAFYYMSISSRGKDGIIWTTWNYPFSYGMKLLPELKIQRVSGDETFGDLHINHQERLAACGVALEDIRDQSPNDMIAQIEKELRAQILHNIQNGLLKDAGEGHIRYSWRGLVFLWVQFLKDIVRLS